MGPWWRRLAYRWGSAGVPVRFGMRRTAVTAVLLVGWLVAFVVGVTSGPDLVCTPVDPSICGPDVGSAWIGVAFATPVLLLWRPRIGALAGIVFAVADLVWDDAVTAQVVFAGHGVLCALGFVVLGRSRTTRRRAPEPPRRHPYFDDVDEERVWWRRIDPRVDARLVGAVLVVLALLFLARYAALVVDEDHHVAAAVRTTAEVEDVTDDDDSTSVTLRVDTPGAFLPEAHVVDVFDTAPYRVGATVPVLVDPHDPAWVRLVAEPLDATGWLVGATFAGTLAVGAGLDRLGRRRERQRRQPVSAF